MNMNMKYYNYSCYFKYSTPDLICGEINCVSEAAIWVKLSICDKI